MGKPNDTRIIEYAYELNTVLEPNAFSNEGWRVRLSINYELQDANHNPINSKTIEHYSEPSQSKRTVAQVTEWFANNREALVAADKLELSGFGG